MNKHETKYKNTAQKMNLALIELMEKKSFDTITIKELCEKAQVNRSTFYSHYQNMNELLEETRNYIVHLFTEEMSSLNISVDHYMTLPDEFLVPYLKVFADHRNIFLISDFHPREYRFSESHVSMMEQIAIPICQSLGITDRNTVTYMTNYYNSGCHAIIMQWLEGGCKESISYICDLIRFCMLGVKSDMLSHT